MTAKILIELSKVFGSPCFCLKFARWLVQKTPVSVLRTELDSKLKSDAMGLFLSNFREAGPVPPPPKLLPQGWYSIFVQEAVSAGLSVHIALVTLTSRDSSTRRETAAVKPACPVFWPKSWSTKDKWQTSNSACQRGWRLKWKQSILTRKVPLLPWRRNAFCLMDSLR